MGSIIQFASNGNMESGYYAPASGGMGPGIIVLQEWWGIVPHIISVVERFSAAGFATLAPDLYGGQSTSEPDEAASLMMALDIARTERMLSSAVDALLDMASCRGPKVGIVGFCMGGQLALFGATLNPKIGACVDYYGIHPNVMPDFSQLHCPVLGFFAEHDEYASAAAVKVLEDELTQHAKPHEFVTYPGTHHAFFNDDRPQVYNAGAAEDSWVRMLAFFRGHLGD